MSIVYVELTFILNFTILHSCGKVISGANAMSAGYLKVFSKNWKDPSPFTPFCWRQNEVVKLSMVYRNRFEIQATILEAAGRGASKTRVMYNSTVSHFQLCSYLKDLLEMGLIEYDSSIRLYRTTTKGYDFLDSYKQLNGMLGERRTR